MSLLDETTLREKLGRLNATQQVIETTSAWCCFFPKEARRIALIWEDVFSKSDQARRLALVYLANDVLQNSRKKGPEFVTEFFKVLPRALRHMLSKSDEKTATSVHKVVRVWEERRVFGSGTKSLKQLMEQADTPVKAGELAAAASALPPVPSAALGNGVGAPAMLPAGLEAAEKLPSLEPLVQALQQVHQAALRCTKLSSACKTASAAVESGNVADMAASQAAVQQYVVAVRGEREVRQQAMVAMQALLRTQEEADARLAVQQDQAGTQLGALEQAAAQLAQQAQQQGAGGGAGGGAGVPSAPAGADDEPGMDLSADYSPTAAAPHLLPPHLAHHASAPSPPATSQPAQPPGAQAGVPPQAAVPAAPAVPSGAAAASMSDAAALAAQLTSNEQSAQALLEALLALPQDQLQSGFALGGAVHAAAQHEQQGGGGEDEYDPEDPFGD